MRASKLCLLSVRLSAVLLLVFGLLPWPAWAEQAATPPVPQLPPLRSYVLMDFHSGNVLLESNGDQRVEPASITKLMTGYVVYKSLKEGHIKLTDQVNISEKAWRTEGSRMFVQIGTKVPLEDLLMGMVVQSGNDATVALAEHVAGSEAAFAELMNKEAARLGMANSHFMNTPGLPHAEHYTSARDIAILVRAIIREFPDQYARYSVREFTYNNIKQPNRNRLLYQDPTVDGVKTGHTATAGYCLAASAKRGDLRMISVVFGTKLDRERFAASQVLLEYGFRNYESVKLHDGNVPLAELRIWKGTINRLPLGLTEALYATVPKGKAGGVQTVLKATEDIVKAPVAQGTPLGSVTINLGETPLSETPLVALQEVPQAGFFGRLWDSILLFFYSLFH